MGFRITGLSAEPFQHLFGLSEKELAKHSAKRYVADEKPGFPCRVGMRDAEPGETVLLLNHTYQPATRLITERTPSSSSRARRSPTIVSIRFQTLCGFACFRSVDSISPT